MLIVSVYITETHSLPCRPEVPTFIPHTKLTFAGPKLLLCNTFSLGYFYCGKINFDTLRTNFWIRSTYCFDHQSDTKILILQTLTQAWATAREHLTRTLLK